MTQLEQQHYDTVYMNKEAAKRSAAITIQHMKGILEWMRKTGIENGRTWWVQDDGINTRAKIEEELIELYFKPYLKSTGC